MESRFILTNGVTKVLVVRWCPYSVLSNKQHQLSTNLSSKLEVCAQLNRKVSTSEPFYGEALTSSKSKISPRSSRTNKRAAPKCHTDVHNKSGVQFWLGQIPWDTINLDQFNIVPKLAAPILRKHGAGWGTFRIVPVESGRGCPYGCEFCTVTGFFGDSIRFRTNESVVNELLLLQARARSERGQIAVFFIDDNFAIDVKRTKSLLRDIIAANAQVNWVAQISANLLRDEELVDLIAAAGGKWIFIGMESIDPANLKDVNKSFNKPGEYAAVLERLAQRNVFAITSFIFGMDNDTPGVAERTLQEVRKWPPGLPIFGPLIPLPATPLYKRLEAAGRLTRPKHWQEFIPFEMAHTPLKMTISEAHAEVQYGWAKSYGPEAIANAVASIAHKPLRWRINILIARLCFRGIYFPQLGRFAWIRTIAQNRRTIFSLFKEGFGAWRAYKSKIPASAAHGSQGLNSRAKDQSA